MQILDEQIPLRQNLKASFRQHWLLWTLLLVTVLADFMTTTLFMQDDGVHTEKNLVIRWLATTLGIVPGVFVGKFLQIIAAIGFSALSLSLARATLLLLLLLNLVAVVINLF